MEITDRDPDDSRFLAPGEENFDPPLEIIFVQELDERAADAANTPNCRDVAEPRPKQDPAS